MEIQDTFVWKNDSIPRYNHFLLPKDIRCLSGKTVLLTYLLLEPKILDFETLTICGRSLHQKEYQIMKHAFQKRLNKSQIKVLFQRQKDVESEGGILKVIDQFSGPCTGAVSSITFEDDPTKIPDPKSFDSDKKNLLVLDDILDCPQSNVQQFFTRGRHNSVNVFYISQSYFRLCRQSIRGNSNFFIFFKQCKKNLHHIYADLCAIDGLEYQEFADFCSSVWNESPHNFVTIDLTRPMRCGKFRKNLNIFWIPATKDVPN